MKTLIVGGYFDLNKGHPSGLITKLYNEWKKYESDIKFINGGNYEDLSNILNDSINYDVIFWMAHVSNELPKIRNIKNINPYALVIGSKRNDGVYSFVEVLNKSIEQRHNLTIEFTKKENLFEMLVFDPLGTQWYKGKEIHNCVTSIYKRVSFLLTTTRKHIYKFDKENVIKENEDFYEYARQAANIFQNTIEHDKGVTRFLGNASFRDKDYIYMSERDVDKSKINKSHFIATFLKDGKAYYLGEKKPSKDTIVQLHLYDKLKNINYIVHSHCYVENAPFTNTPVPCGALEEIDEVMEVILKNYKNKNLDYYIVNLKGHGCLVFGKTIELMKKTKFITRHLPEKL